MQEKSGVLINVSGEIETQKVPKIIQAPVVEIIEEHARTIEEPPKTLDEISAPEIEPTPSKEPSPPPEPPKPVRTHIPNLWHHSKSRKRKRGLNGDLFERGNEFSLLHEMNQNKRKKFEPTKEVSSIWATSLSAAFPQSKELQTLLKTEELLLDCLSDVDQTMTPFFNLSGEIHTSNWKDALIEFYKRNKNRFSKSILTSYLNYIEDNSLDEHFVGLTIMFRPYMRRKARRKVMSGEIDLDEIIHSSKSTSSFVSHGDILHVPFAESEQRVVEKHLTKNGGKLGDLNNLALYMIGRNGRYIRHWIQDNFQLTSTGTYVRLDLEQTDKDFDSQWMILSDKKDDDFKAKAKYVGKPPPVIKSQAIHNVPYQKLHALRDVEPVPRSRRERTFFESYSLKLLAVPTENADQGSIYGICCGNVSENRNTVMCCLGNENLHNPDDCHIFALDCRDNSWTNLGGHTNGVTDVTFSATGKFVFTGGWDRVVNMYDHETIAMRKNKEPIKPMKHTRSGIPTNYADHKDIGRITSLNTMKVNGVDLIAIGRESAPMLSLWNADKNNCVTFTARHMVTWMDVSWGEKSLPNHILATTKSDEVRRDEAYLFDISQCGLHVVNTYRAPLDHTFLRPTPFPEYGSNSFLCSTDDTNLWLIDPRKPSSELWMKIDTSKILKSYKNLRGKHKVTALSFSPTGHSLATCGLDNSVCVWDWRFPNGRSPTHYFEHCPHKSTNEGTTQEWLNGDLIVTAAENEVKLWSTRGASSKIFDHSFTDSFGAITTLDVTHDATEIFVGSDSGWMARFTPRR